MNDPISKNCSRNLQQISKKLELADSAYELTDRQIEDLSQVTLLLTMLRTPPANRVSIPGWEKCKVYYVNDGKYRYMVAAPNKKSGAFLLTSTVGYLNNYGGTYTNVEYVTIAKTMPHYIWRQEIAGAEHRVCDGPWHQWRRSYS